jgi:hypothetical protein
LTEYQNLKILELFTIMIRENGGRTESEKKEVGEYISFETAKSVFLVIVALLSSKTAYKNLSNTDVEAILLSVFDESKVDQSKGEREIKFWDFEFYINKLFPSLNKNILESLETMTIKNVIFLKEEREEHKVRVSKKKKKVGEKPKLSKMMKDPESVGGISAPIVQSFPGLNLNKESEFLSGSMLTSLFLLIPQLSSVQKLTKIYSSNDDGFSFNRLAYSIVFYTEPIVILLRHFDKEKGNTHSLY